MNSRPLIVVDGRMVGEFPHGIARYVSQFAEGLGEIYDGSSWPYELLFLTHASSKKGAFGNYRTHQIQSEFLNPAELIEIPRTLKSLGASLYHSPSFASLFFCPCPSVVTIHDLNHLTYGSWSKKIYYQTLLRRFAKKSRAIMTVSEFSRDEISRWLPCPSSQIEIVYNTISPPPRSSVGPEVLLEKLGLKSGQFFLCISNSKPHKNVALLKQAYRQYASSEKTPWPLVLTLNEGPEIPGILALVGLSDSDTQALLNSAGGLFFPSLYEGFGLPPLEGAVVGLPLVVSDIPPHREGLVDLSSREVLWVEPHRVEGWVEAFRKLVRGEVEPPTPQSQAKILSRFSRNRMARSLDQVYRRVLGSQT